MRRLDLCERGMSLRRGGKSGNFLGGERAGGGGGEGKEGALRISLQDEGILFGFYLVW